MPSNQKGKGEKEAIKQKTKSTKSISKNQRLDVQKSDSSNPKDTISKKKSSSLTEKSKKTTNSTTSQNSKKKDSMTSASSTKKISKEKQKSQVLEKSNSKSESASKSKKIEKEVSKKQSSGSSVTKKKDSNSKNSKAVSLKSKGEIPKVNEKDSKISSSSKASSKNTSQSKQNINLIEKQKSTKNGHDLSKQKIKKDKSGKFLLLFKRKNHSKGTSGISPKEGTSVSRSKKNTSKKNMVSSKKEKSKKTAHFSWTSFIKRRFNKNRSEEKNTSQSKQNINLIEKQKSTKNGHDLSKQKIKKDKSGKFLLLFKRKNHSKGTSGISLKEGTSVSRSKKNTSKKNVVSSKKKKSKKIAHFSWTSFIKRRFNKKRPVEKKTTSKKQLKKKTSIIIPKKLILVFIIICVLIILIETVYFIYHRIYANRNTIYYDSLNSLSIDNMDVVMVGSSNFKYSKYYDYTGGLEKAKLIKYGSDGKILFEKMYDRGINTTFSSVISVNDGYVVVGSGEFSEKEQQEGGREAIIIKYDKEGNIIWEKYYQVVTNTRFNKVIEVSDGYVAVGQSIYANMEMGNHTTGGGIIVKYDKDGNEMWHNNHGGMKSGSFNDIVEVDGNFYVVGKDATDSANLVKFNNKGEYQWHKNYSYTDGIGFTGIVYLNKNLYVVGAKKVLPEGIDDNDNRDTKNTDALFIKYSLDGKIIFEKSFGGSNYERYNSILAYRDDLYVVGHTTSKDAGLKINTDGELMTGILIRYDQNGNILRKESLGGSNNDNLTDIVTDDVSLYISAYSNSGDGNITTAKNNGKDYFGKFIKLDFKFRTLLVK